MFSVLAVKVFLHPAGLARTVFMENRGGYGPTIDLPCGAALPSASALRQVAQCSGEFAAAFHLGRWYSLRMLPAPSIAPQRCSIDPSAAHIISGGTKVCGSSL